MKGSSSPFSIGDWPLNGAILTRKNRNMRLKKAGGISVFCAKIDDTTPYAFPHPC
jgi:hypothetical protein